MGTNEEYRDENGRLHRLDGPAKVARSPDGSAAYYYYIHGDLIMEVGVEGSAPDTTPRYQAAVLPGENDLGIKAHFYLSNTVSDGKETAQEVNIYVGDFSSHLVYRVCLDQNNDAYMFIDNKYKSDHVCSLMYPGHFHSSVPELPGTLHDDSSSSCGSRDPMNAKGTAIFYDHQDESNFIVSGSFGTELGRHYLLPAISTNVSYTFSTGEISEPLLYQFIARGGPLVHSVGKDVHIFKGVDYTAQMQELYAVSSGVDVDDPGFVLQIDMMEDKTRE